MNDCYMFLPDPDPDHPNQYIANQMVGHHTGELLWGFKGNGYYYQPKRLKNNWKVDYIDLTVEDGGARLDGSSIGTDSPYAMVHWWVEACSFCSYYVSWHIKGPKGCSYY
jgi:hypothetical protein